MNKYQIHMHRRAVKTVDFSATSPHEAVVMAREANPEFHADFVWELIEDPEKQGKEIEGCTLSVAGACETCSKPILTGDSYFEWGGDEPSRICSGCCEEDERNKLVVA